MTQYLEKNVIVTGGTDGIGKAIALKLAEQGAYITLVGRNMSKGQATVKEIIGATRNPNITFQQADLLLMRDVQQMADIFMETHDHLDVLIHSAGAMFREYAMTDEGIERTFALQYLARFVLTNALIERLHRVSKPQVVSISGAGASRSTLAYENINSQGSYSMFSALMQASTANDLLTLSQIAHYPRISFYNYGPGYVRTSLRKPESSPLIGSALGFLSRAISISAKQAANDISLLLMTAPNSGLYRRGIKPTKPNAYISDISNQRRLWAFSESFSAVNTHLHT